jgi:hypothetical protein
MFRGTSSFASVWWGGVDGSGTTIPFAAIDSTPIPHSTRHRTRTHRTSSKKRPGKRFFLAFFATKCGMDRSIFS